MAKLAIKKASTDVTTYVFIQDSSKTTGVGLAGLAYNTGSLVGYYVRPKGSATAITLATQTVTGDHSDGGFVEIDATNMPGVYRLDLPDAVCATGVPSVVVMLKGATNMSPVVLEIQLTDFDLNTAAITAAGIADAVWDEAISGHTTGTTFGGKNQKVVPSETINDYKADVSGLALEATLAAIKGAGWSTETLEFIGGKGTDIVQLLTEDGVIVHPSMGFATTTHLQEVEDKVDSILEDTGTDGVVLANDTITAAKFDESTAFPIKSADAGSTLIARAGADSYDLTDINDTLAAIKGAGWTNQTLVKIVTDISAISAGSGATAQEVWEYATRVLTAGTNIDLSALATATDLATVDTVVDAIKAKTDNLPASPAEAGEYTAAIAAIPTTPLLAANYTAPDNAGIAAVKAKTDNLPADPADDSDIDAQLAAIKSVIDNIHDTDLPAVKAETALIVEDTGTTIPALLETIDNFIDTEVAAILEDTGTTLPATLATIAGYTDGIAGDVWSYTKRTLTHPSVSAEEPEDSNTLILYRDADIAIELTDLTIPVGAKKYIFTIKDNLDSGDDQAVLQASYAIDGSEVETNTLVYINSAAAPVLTNPVTFTLTETNITIDLTAEAAALLPRYERGYLNWDLKLVTDAAVTIVLQGLAQIIGTSTRAIE